MANSAVCCGPFLERGVSAHQKQLLSASHEECLALCAPHAPGVPRGPETSQPCPVREGPGLGSAGPVPPAYSEQASPPSVSKGGAGGAETGSLHQHLYLLRPRLQLLPLLQADLPNTGQQVMRGDEDPGAQEKCKDVCPLKKRDKVRGSRIAQAWCGPSRCGQSLSSHPPGLPAPSRNCASSCMLCCTWNALPFLSLLPKSRPLLARHRSNPPSQQLPDASPDKLSSQQSYSTLCPTP